VYLDVAEKKMYHLRCKNAKHAFNRSNSVNYHKFCLNLALFLGTGVLASLILFPNPCLAADLPAPLSFWRLDEASQPYKDSADSNDGMCITDNLDFCPDPIPGKIGQAQLFDGVSEGIDVPGDSFNWASTDSFSVTFWIKHPEPPSAENEVVVGREDRVKNALHWWTGVHENDGSAMFVLIDSGETGFNNEFYLLSTTTVTDGAWHYVVAVRDADQNMNMLYIDGFLEDSVSITYPNNFASSLSDLNIGYMQEHNRKSYYLNGTADDIQIYSVALSDSEIADLYQQESGRNLPYVPLLLLDTK